MVRSEATDMRFYERQEDVILNQANPISGTEYLVLNETYVRVISAAFSVTWTVQPNLQAFFIQSGNVTTYTIAAPATAVFHYPERQGRLGPANQTLIVVERTDMAYLMEEKNLRISEETTGGTAQNLDARIKFSRYI